MEADTTAAVSGADFHVPSEGSVAAAAASADKRERFFRERFPTFFATDDGHNYALYEAHVVDRAYIRSVRDACADAWRIYRKTAPLLRALPEQTLLEMGIPESAVACSRLCYPEVPACVVGRFDFIMTEDGPKMMEFNAETPYFYWESHRISGEAVRSLGYDDPNEGMEKMLGNALAAALRRYGQGRIVVTGYETCAEDNMTARYATDVLREATGFSIDFAPLEELTVRPDGLYDAQGKIDILYRFYPLELFALDEGGEAFFHVLERDLLRVVNPPCSLLLQNKCAQVLIWGLYERKEYFDAEEREIISRVFLPSYAELPDDDFDYVCKPVFGREGNSVSIIRRAAPARLSPARDYADQPMIFQRYVELPKVSYMHPQTGSAEGRAVTTCFIAGEQPTAVGMRVGGEITDAWSHFLPLAYAPENGDLS